MAIPSRIVALDGMMATVECFGEQRDVSLILLVDEVVLGDYVLVQAGRFAYQRIEAEPAQEALRAFSEIIAASES
ncbi:MAG: HypC/HybG/HupF family hydrogenase formation chaperone [Sulfuricella sp.]